MRSEPHVASYGPAQQGPNLMACRVSAVTGARRSRKCASTLNSLDFPWGLCERRRTRSTFIGKMSSSPIAKPREGDARDGYR